MESKHCWNHLSESKYDFVCESRKPTKKHTQINDRSKTVRTPPHHITLGSLSPKKKFGWEFPLVVWKKSWAVDLWRRTSAFQWGSLSEQHFTKWTSWAKGSGRALRRTAFRVRNTYRTIVLRNQGLLAMEGTASSIRGCILMKLSVSSGNSLDTLYLSMDGEPAQLPGLAGKRSKRKKC